MLRAPFSRPWILIIVRSRFSFSYTSCTTAYGSGSCTSHTKNRGPISDEKSSSSVVVGFGMFICASMRAEKLSSFHACSHEFTIRSIGFAMRLRAPIVSPPIFVTSLCQMSTLRTPARVSLRSKALACRVRVPPHSASACAGADAAQWGALTRRAAAGMCTDMAGNCSMRCRRDTLLTTPTGLT